MNLKAIRQAAGLSQIALSKRSGVKRARLQGAEAGYIELSNHEMAAVTAVICEAPLRIAGEIRAVLAATTEEKGRSRQP